MGAEYNVNTVATESKNEEGARSTFMAAGGNGLRTRFDLHIHEQACKPM